MLNLYVREGRVKTPIIIEFYWIFFLGNMICTSITMVLHKDYIIETASNIYTGNMLFIPIQVSLYIWKIFLMLQKLISY